MLLVAAHSDCVCYAHMAQPYQTHSITYTPDNGKQWFCPSLIVGSLKLDLKILIRALSAGWKSGTMTQTAGR